MLIECEDRRLRPRDVGVREHVSAHGANVDVTKRSSSNRSEEEEEKKGEEEEDDMRQPINVVLDGRLALSHAQSEMSHSQDV